MNYTYATIISCMDGRIQKPLRDFAIEKFGVSVADVITDRGGLLRHLSGESAGYIDNILRSVQVSLEAHESTGIIIAGHQKCVGYSTTDEKKKKEIRQAAYLLEENFPDVEIIPVFVKEGEPEWKVEELS